MKTLIFFTLIFNIAFATGDSKDEKLKLEDLPRPSMDNPMKRFETMEFRKALQANDMPKIQQFLDEGYLDSYTLFWNDAQSVEAAQALLQAGADPNVTDAYGVPPLVAAANTDIKQLLLDAGADPNLKNRVGMTPLHFLASSVGRWKKVEDLQLLLNAGADPNVQDNNGDTPLHDAITPEAAQTLLNGGANPHIQNKDRLTAVHRDPDSGVMFKEHLTYAVIRQFMERPSSCTYISESERIAPVQCGQKAICSSKVSCKFHIEDQAFLKNFNAFCSALEDNNCPSATQCAISSSVVEYKEAGLTEADLTEADLQQPSKSKSGTQ